MGIIWTIIIGFVAGVIAKFIMPGKDPGGFLVTIGIGIAGSLIANFLGGALGWYGDGRNAGIFGSTVGAIILLAIYRMFKGKGAAKT